MVRFAIAAALAFAMCSVALPAGDSGVSGGGEPLAPNLPVTTSDSADSTDKETGQDSDLAQADANFAKNMGIFVESVSKLMKDDKQGQDAAVLPEQILVQEKKDLN
ncbi:hypothetical protein HRG_001261 [Hirsutella rhossiliensis]|uniref:Uncharacterized protein n=1 Tax=Hirsutella rhossiliensis TaxID=111463 RepID=A0A9P8N8D6_9HYPO|nr:uncharacterized protein HRG_01261 [Hirsutella rhossiliensis]KAH0968619.1 hypothetical protein HRG_01261 [Hirsutella rhossiliensis]